jgi:hypothetical protein
LYTKKCHCSINKSSTHLDVDSEIDKNDDDDSILMRLARFGFENFCNLLVFCEMKRFISNTVA